VVTLRELGPNSRVEFFDLRTRAEDDSSVVVGRADTGVFVSLPELGAVIIHELNRGAQIGEVEQDLSAQGAEIDVADFVNQLSESGFVRAVDGISDPDAPAVRSASLPWLRACHVRWLFTWQAYAVCLLVVVTAAAALVVQPRVRPRYGDIFFSGSTSAVLAGSAVLFLVIVAFHEFAHLASARASGVPARISFGTRLYSLVAQTDVSGMWAASPRERLRTYLAGTGMDLVFGSVLVLERAVRIVGGTLDHVIAAAVVIILSGIAGQFELFIRTDMYFVAAHLLRARNLFEDATVEFVHTLRSLISKVPGAHPLAGLPDRERRVVRAYSLIMVLGTLAALTVFAVYLLPALVILLARGAHRLVEGISYGNFPLALDGGATLVVVGGTELLVVVLMLRSRMPWINSLRGRLRQFGEPT
jgi:putative peptide zinc metalloprotease protein